MLTPAADASFLTLLCLSSGFQGDQGSKIHVCQTGRPEARSCGQRVRSGGLLQAAVQEPWHRSVKNGKVGEWFSCMSAI